MKVTIYSSHDYEMPFLEKSSEAKHELLFLRESLNESTASLACGSRAVCLFTSDDANAATLEKLRELGVQYIALRSVGHDHVDTEKCRQLGIKVANVPEYSPYAVAEHAAALLFCLNRKILTSQPLMKQQDFRLDALVGFDLHGKTIGIVGTGKIGAAFAKIANGLGCRLLACDIKENEALKGEMKIDYVSFDDLCHRSDVISLHCPLNSQTKHLLNERSFALMRKGVFIINTSRGGVIKTEALISAIENGTVGAAGLDVYEYEKGLFFEDHRKDKINDDLYNKLKALPSVLLTGHQAFLTQEALQNIADTTIYNLDCWEAGKDSPNSL